MLKNEHGTLTLNRTYSLLSEPTDDPNMQIPSLLILIPGAVSHIENYLTMVDLHPNYVVW